MTVVIPMCPPVDPETQTRERAEYIIKVFATRLSAMALEDSVRPEYALPLPWYAHENSRELELVVAHFKPLWGDLKLRRGVGCLEMVFIR